MCNKNDTKTENLIFDSNVITRNALKKRKNTRPNIQGSHYTPRTNNKCLSIKDVINLIKNARNNNKKNII